MSVKKKSRPGDGFLGYSAVALFFALLMFFGGAAFPAIFLLLLGIGLLVVGYVKRGSEERQPSR